MKGTVFVNFEYTFAELLNKKAADAHGQNDVPVFVVSES
jgi:hypothetical protein